MTKKKQKPTTRFKILVEIERIETDAEGNETYHDEDFPESIGYRETYKDAEELQQAIVDAFGELPAPIKKKAKTKTLWLCPHCGSDNVEHKTWVNANTNEISDYDNGEEGNGYCNDCEEHGELITGKVKADTEIIGFQVVGAEGYKNEGDIHPKMAGSFCLYSLSQAKAMFNGSYNWKLLAIWTGDVEEPTLMFKGNPRD
jgi:hypothetical protein